MCGRFTLRASPHQLALAFPGEFPPDLMPRYNIAPTQGVAALRAGAEAPHPQFIQLRWGLVPSWAKDAAGSARLINARAETVAEKPAFRAAFRRRRCLVLADGYYEWQKTEKNKQPYLIHFRDEQPFAFAGLWERWQPTAVAEPLESCTIITTAANDLTRPIHDRMPVILDPPDFATWLDPKQGQAERLLSLLRPYASKALAVDPVETWVNNPQHDDPRCVAPRRTLFET
jgi:putative SOS response-associated peptidase YedK